MLPQWIRRVISLGTEGLPAPEARKFLALNSTTLFVIVLTAGYVSFYSLYQAPVFWKEAGFLAAMVGAYICVFILTARGRAFAALVILTSLGLTHLGVITWLLGEKSGAHLYLLVFPVIVAICSDQRQLWFIWPVSLASACILLIVELFRPEGGMVLLPDWIVTLLFTADVFGTVLLIAILAFIFRGLVYSAETALEAEHARSEALLYNLLPEDIATRLKVEPDKTIADNLPQVAILFADIVDFTPRSAQMSPTEIVNFLNRIFSEFDHLAEKHGLEKIKTIGDSYMVAAGMPNPCGDPAHRVAEMALDMLDVTRELSSELDDTFEVRIGLHTGPAVAGVIGNSKLFYDVWGETVNTASRMESHGQAGRIQVTKAARNELRDRYFFESRGMIEVKGMGIVETWWLKTKAST